MQFKDSPNVASAIANSTLISLLPTLTFATNLTPPATIAIDPSVPAPSSGLMQLLQPTVTLNTDLGPVQVAPYGPSFGLNPATWALYLALSVGGVAGLFMWIGTRIAAKKN